MLAKKELLLPDVNKVHLDKCPYGLAKNQNKVAFHPRLSMRRKKILELDSKSDACAQYFVTFCHSQRSHQDLNS